MASNLQSSEPDREFKVVLVGDKGVGKTAFVLWSTEGTFDPNSKYTVNAYFRPKKVTWKDKTVKLQIWDTAGEEKYGSSLTPIYCRNADAVLICYDITNLKSFQNVDKWLNLNGMPEEALFILVGCKLDLEKSRVVSTAMGQEKAGVLCQGGVRFYETSAKTNINIGEVFKYLVDHLMPTSDDSLSQIFKLEDQPQIPITKKKSSCCSR